MARLTREAILARKLGQEEVELSDGATVMVRGLTRAEAIEMGQLGTVAERDAWMVATGLVDPELSVDDVVAWFGQGAAGDADRIAKKITELSGMADGQAKGYTKSVPRRRR